MSERFLVTGALGCIGAWTVKRLVDEGVPVWTYDLPGDPHRLRLIMDAGALAKVNFIGGDITDDKAFGRAVADNGITHVIHLAAFQVPFVKADPLQGVKVNVVGTAVVLETLRRNTAQIQGFAYASSAGVYGRSAMYPDGVIKHDSPLLPTHLYGVHKQADEGMARIYDQDYGLRSIGLRPYVIYGPGRDQGMTSTPTKAMLAAAVGRAYHISYGGTVVFHHADDAAAAFIQAARKSNAGTGAPVYNLGGTTESMDAVVAHIEAAAPGMKGKITFNPQPLDTAPDVDGRPLDDAIGKVHWVPMAEGVRRTIEVLRAGVAAGGVNVDRILSA
jgi:UDP-glucuronate 4-epimerase